jgi:ABC-type multidrug transport system fused ATPase/permease subunit
MSKMVEKGGDAIAVGSDVEAPPEKRTIGIWEGLLYLNGFFTQVDGYYTAFMGRYVFLVAAHLQFAITVSVGTYVANIDLDDGLIQQKIYVLVGVIAGSYLLMQIAKPFREALLMWYRVKGGETIGTAMIAKIFNLPLGEITTTPTGEFTQLLVQNGKITETFHPAFYGIAIPLCVETLFLFIFLSAAYKYAGMVILVLFVTFSTVGYITALRMSDRSQNELRNGMQMFGKLVGYMASYERAHYFGNVDHTIGLVRDAITEYNVNRYNDKVGELSEEFPMLMFGVVCHVLAPVLIALSMEGSTLFQRLAMIGYVVGVYLTELQQFTTALAQIRTGVSDFTVVREFLERPNAVGDRPGAVELAPGISPAIEFKNVVFSYGERVILDDVSFKVDAGSRLGVVGSSGCGKSTIMKLLLRFYAPTSGTITVNGQDIYSVTADSLRSLFSVVTQDSQLFNGTIRENIGYGKLGSSDDDILHAAKLAELALGATEGENNDMNLDKPCGEKGAHLSGGQQQRVALARAMLKNGMCYLLDEPTTGLDGVVARQLQDTFDEITQASSTIMITHHLEDLKNADQIIYLDQGKILEHGTFDELVGAKGEFYSQLEARKRAS